MNNHVNDLPRQAASKPALTVQPRPLGELLDATIDLLRRYVSFQFAEQPIAIALWVAHTWAFNAADYTPYLHVFSAETSSGKSRLLEVLALLANKPWKVESVSVAALFRRIEMDQPALLYDEIDNVFRESGKDDDTKDLRACLNSGFKRGGKFTRCVGQNANLEVKEFATFSPKVLAGIGKVLSDTLSNRCIPIELVRRTRDEKVARFRERDVCAEFFALQRKFAAWAQQAGVVETLQQSRPFLPEQFSDRQQDIAEPLLAIADMAGGNWPTQARAALVRLCTESTTPVVSTGIQLLTDLKAIFDREHADRLSTRDILVELIAIEGRPWAFMFEEALKFDRLQSAASKLAKKLRVYKKPDGTDIEPRSIKVNDGAVVRGYYKEDFLAAWDRYLPVAASSATDSEGATNYTREGSGSSGSSTSAEYAGADNPNEPTPIVVRYAGKGATSATGATNEGKTVAANDCVMPEGATAVAGATCNAMEDGKIVYPGDWIPLYPTETEPYWLSALGQVLGKPCEVCGEAMDNEPCLWLHRTRYVGRCPSCQQTEWWADGYEIDEFGNPTCWSDQHSREQRIAERDLAMLERATKTWKASTEGRYRLGKARRECDRLGIRNRNLTSELLTK
jgi:hypothetical protein